MTEQLRALLVDDEELARRGLEIRLEQMPGIEVCGHCRNGREAVRDVQALKPDIVFLDIQMPGMDGFETLQGFAGPEMPAVIFVTAYAQHAIQAFEANALDYLLKPIDDQRLLQAIERVREHRATVAAAEHRDRLLKLICDITGEEITLDAALQGLPQARQPSLRRLAIRDGKSTECVDIDDIDWIEAAGDYLCIHALGKTHVLRGTMKKMESILDTDRFARVHRSSIVNLSRVHAFRSHTNGEYFLSMNGGKEIKVSRSYKDQVRKIAAK